jgi:hypothetical protein
LTNFKKNFSLRRLRPSYVRISVFDRSDTLSILPLIYFNIFSAAISLAVRRLRLSYVRISVFDRRDTLAVRRLRPSYVRISVFDRRDTLSVRRLRPSYVRISVFDRRETLWILLFIFFLRIYPPSYKPLFAFKKATGFAQRGYCANVFKI